MAQGKLAFDEHVHVMPSCYGLLFRWCVAIESYKHVTGKRIWLLMINNHLSPPGIAACHTSLSSSAPHLHTIIKMRFLCLHGKGTNSDIFEAQLGKL